MKLNKSWWTYLLPVYGMANIVDDLFGFFGNKDSVAAGVGKVAQGGTRLAASLPDVLADVFSGISGFDWSKGISDLFNYYTGGVTSSQLESQRFNAQEAERQRAWEQEMSNTAFQRQVTDMSAAGVNPALMYGGAGSSGASTPSGAAASSSASPGAGNIFDAIFQMATLPLERKYKAAQARKEAAQADKAEVEADVAEETKGTQIEIVFQTLQNLRETHSEIVARIGKENAQKALALSEKALKEAETTGMNLDNFFKQFRKNLTEKYGLDPNQTSIPSGLIAVCMAIADHIEETATSAAEKTKQWTQTLVSIAKSFGKDTARKIAIKIRENGGPQIEDNTFEVFADDGFGID